METLVAIETEHFILEMREGIIIGTYKTERITLEIAKEVVRERLAFTENKAYPIMVLDGGVKEFDRAARQYLGSEIGFKGIKAGAIVTKSVFSALLANFFIKIHVIRPKVPVRMFTSEEEAFDWLTGFIN